MLTYDNAIKVINTYNNIMEKSNLPYRLKISPTKGNVKISEINPISTICYELDNNCYLV